MPGYKKLVAGIIITATGFAFIACQCHARVIAGRAGAYTRLGLGADRVAMGNLGVANPFGTENWFYNPASIASTTSKQATIGYRSMSLDRNIMHVGFSMPLEPNAGIAFGIMRAGISDIDGRDSNGEHFQTLSWADNMFHGTFSLRPHPRVALGVSIKWFNDTVPDILENDKNLNSYGIGIDLGALVTVLDNLRIGVQVRDIDSKITWDAADVWGDDAGPKEDRVPFMIRLGGTWNANEHLMISAETEMFTHLMADDAEAFKPHLGIEWKNSFTKDKGISLRTGLNGDQPAFGFGLNYRASGLKIGTNYAFVTGAESLAGSHIFDWVFEW